MANLLGDDMFGIGVEEETTGSNPPLQPRMAWLTFEEVAVPEYAVHYLMRDQNGNAVVVLTTGHKLNTGNTFEDALEALE